MTKYPQSLLTREFGRSMQMPTFRTRQLLSVVEHILMLEPLILVTTQFHLSHV